MPKPLRFLVPVVLAVSLGAAGPRSVPLFVATFDGGIQPEIGVLTGAQGAPSAQLVPDGSGGEALALDDTGLGAVGVEIRARFPQGEEVSTGRVVATWTLTFGQADGILLAGGLAGSPSDALIPVGGSGGQGTIEVAGQSTGMAVPVNEPVDFTLILERDNAHKDWAYTFVVAPASQGAENSIARTGMLPGTADQPLTGIGFLESPLTNGSYVLDDVSVELELP